MVELATGLYDYYSAPVLAAYIADINTFPPPSDLA